MRIICSLEQILKNIIFLRQDEEVSNLNPIKLYGHELFLTWCDVKYQQPVTPLLSVKDAATAKWCKQAERSSMHEEVEIIE